MLTAVTNGTLHVHEYKVPLGMHLPPPQGFWRPAATPLFQPKLLEWQGSKASGSTQWNNIQLRNSSGHHDSGNGLPLATG